MNDIKDIKKLKGLITPKKYIVRNLSEYIKHLAKFELQEYYFRGESNYYHDIVSSGLRDDNVDYRSKLPFYHMIRDYYKEIGQRISSLDRKSFTAFSQHHGIPTNLTDITTSPLISLYFACQGDANNNRVKNISRVTSEINSQTGFVYAISKKKTIDITEHINKFNEIHINIIDILSSKKPEIIKENYEIFKLFFEGNPNMLEYYLGKLLGDYEYYKIDIFSRKNNYGFLKKAAKGFGLKISNALYQNPEKTEVSDKYYMRLFDLIITLKEELNISLDEDEHYYDYDNMLIYIYYLLTKKFLIITKEVEEYILV